eukprot:1502478-Pleurochrysis_carterae.AAC.2
MCALAASTERFEHHARLCFAHAPLSHIAEGVRRIAAAASQLRADDAAAGEHGAVVRRGGGHA